MVVKRSLTTNAANAFNHVIRSKSADSTSNRLDLKAMTKNLGSVSSLPPLAVAAERELFDEATKAALAAGDDEASLDSAEDALFDDEFDISPDSEEAEGELEEIKAEPEPIIIPAKRKVGRPRKLTPDELAAAEAEAIRNPPKPPVVREKKNKGRERKTSPPIVQQPVITKSGKTIMFQLTDLLPDVPPRGDFDLNKVRDSPYFFS